MYLSDLGKYVTKNRKKRYRKEDAERRRMEKDERVMLYYAVRQRRRDTQIRDGGKEKKAMNIGEVHGAQE